MAHDVQLRDPGSGFDVLLEDAAGLELTSFLFCKVFLTCTLTVGAPSPAKLLAANLSVDANLSTTLTLLAPPGAFDVELRDPGTAFNVDLSGVTFVTMDADLAVDVNLNAAMAVLDTKPPSTPVAFPGTENVILVEVEVGKEISKEVSSAVWTQGVTIGANSYANVWYIDTSIEFNFEALEFVRLEIDGQETTAQASIADCNGTVLSWYYRRAIKRLYIRPEAGADPNLLIVNAWGLWTISNRPKHLNGRFYHPLVGSRNETRTTRRVDNQFFRFQQSEAGKLVIMNPDGLLDEVASSWIFAGGKTVIRQGFDTTSSSGNIAYADYVQILAAECDGIETFDDTEMVLTFKTVHKKLDTNAFNLFYESEADSDYPEQDTFTKLVKSIEGRTIQVGFGDFDEEAVNDDRANFALAIPSHCVDTGTLDKSSGNYFGTRWQWIGRMYDRQTKTHHGPNSVSRVYHQKATGQIIKVDTAKWITEKDNTVIFFPNNKGYGIDPFADRIAVVGGGISDVSGKFTGGGNAGMKLFPDILHFYYNQAGVKEKDLDLVSFASARTHIPSWITDTANWKGHQKVWLEEQTTIQEVCDNLCAGSGAIPQEGTDGKIVIVFLEHETQVSDVTLLDADIADYRERKLREFAMSRMVLEYRPSPKNDRIFRKIKNKKTRLISYPGVSYTMRDTPAESLYGIQNEKTLRTYIKRKEEAKDRVNYLYSIFRRGNRFVTCKDISGKTMKSLLGQRVLLTRRRAIGGPINEKAFWIMGIAKDFGSGVTDLELLEIPRI